VIADVVAHLGVTVTVTGTLTGTVSTGLWSGRTVLEASQEILRTWAGMLWARPRDGQALAIGSNLLWPATSALTISLATDCIGAPRLTLGTESQPTRVDASWPGGKETAIDTAAEAGGVVRSRSISTVADSSAQARAAAQAVLDRAGGGDVSFSAVVVDLSAAVNDPTPTLFEETSTLGGLFPSQRLTLEVPSTHFGTSTKDVFVLGWTEAYGHDRSTVTLDTIPA